MQYWNDSSPAVKAIIIVAVAIIAFACVAACAGAAYLLWFQDDETPTATAEVPAGGATPAATVAVEGWIGEYFDNRDLQGEPVLVRDDLKIDFDWGDGSPSAEVPADNFSVRWTTARELPAGTYRFSMAVDDGARLWVDDVLIIDAWTDGAKTVSHDLNLIRGPHAAVVEYYEGTGTASIKLEVTSLDEYPNWKAEYFDNTGLSGEPVVVRNEMKIEHNWGSGSPAPGVPSDDYSVRWTQTAFVETGEYIIRVEVEGGVRIWLDGSVVIDDWTSTGLRSLEAPTGLLEEGDHNLRVEYFKETGNGSIRGTWTVKQEAGPPTAVIAGPAEATVGQVVKYSGQQSGAAPGSQIVSSEWDFGDGIRAQGASVAHIYDSPGTFRVQLTVTDDKGLSGTDTLDVKVNPAPTPPPDQTPPEAVIVAPGDGQIGQQITFDGSQSKSTTPLVAYYWDFGDGTTANAKIVNKVYTASGIFHVVLTVVDSESQEDSTVHQITIYPPSETPTPQPTGTTEATAPPSPTDTVEATEPSEPTATDAPLATDTTEPMPTDTDEPAATDTTEPEPTDTEEPDATATDVPEATMTATLTPTLTMEPSPTP